ncbi:MAG: APC family permease [Bacteroidetes bacterium]|nr:APC family permease [Bacteroidota bacterium]
MIISVVTIIQRLKNLIIGKGKSVHDKSVFHQLTLIAFFAWVGLGADGLSSSCYGPEEAFRALAQYPYLSLFIAIGTALTIFIISASYSQIIELFPTGGGGYLVASKLLSPNIGMVAGCSLLIDYVLTITISIASGVDAVFSFLPVHWAPYKLIVGTFGVGLLIILNLRGVKESVTVLLPIFMIFVITHVAAIIYVIVAHLGEIPAVAGKTMNNFSDAQSNLGLWGTIVLMLRAYSMGAGTYTGIEAVSNAMPILREPRVETAKKTMKYMASSLAFVAVGLMIAYALFNVQHVEGKTLNAVLFEQITSGWGSTIGYSTVLVVLISEAVLLFVAAQTGFLGGPQILSNMALDRWFPTRFATFSDRLVTQNGVLLVGVSAAVMMIVTGGSVHHLVVMYSINVFITFTLSQLGMVKHWITVRKQFKQWKKKITVNGIGLIMTTFILISVVIIKFTEGGWITLLLTGGLAALVISFKRHYTNTSKLLKRLDDTVLTVIDDVSIRPIKNEDLPENLITPNRREKTAVFLVNGFSGLGLHTLFTVMRAFDGVFKNFIFVQAGVIDAGNFKGTEEVDALKIHINSESQKYVNFMKHSGLYAESICGVGTDVVNVVGELAPAIVKKFPNAIFFGGQVVFPKESILSKWLHNYTVFAVQRKLYFEGIPVVILPVKV